MPGVIQLNDKVFMRLTLKFLIFPLLFTLPLVSQQAPIVKISASEVSGDNQSFFLVVTADIDPLYHIYGTEQLNGPVPTALTFQWPKNIISDGKLIEPPGQKHFDEGFGLTVTWHSGRLVFKQPLRAAGALSGADSITVQFRYQACTESYCLPPKTVSLTYRPSAALIQFSKNSFRQAPVTLKEDEEIKSADVKSDTAVSAMTDHKKSINDRVRSYDALRSESLWSFIGLAFLTGFIALLTPCVFPMIPITVSYFTKHSASTRAQALKQSLVYISGIIVSFTLFGWLMSIVIGAAGAQNFAANIWVNLAIGTLFVVFSLSLFGVFEIRLPSFLVNFSQSHSETGRTAGTLFAGITFTLVSFTCTVQFLGLLMVASANGEWFLPVIGMLCFAAAFSLPFFFLSLFPQYIANLPKSGSWLHATKIVMALVEVAAALKFFSNVDLVWDLELLTRPVLLSIWIVLFGVCGFYLLGKIKFSEDDTVQKIGAWRTGLAFFFLSLTVYLVSGLFGHPLQADMDAYLPPSDYGMITRADSKSNSDVWIEDYSAALAKSRETGKPMFIDFTGKTCTNCRLMEKTMFVRGDVADYFDRMVLTRLWTDYGDHQEANQALEQRLVGSVALPFYAIVDGHENVLAKFGGLERDAEIFKLFLKNGLDQVQDTAAK